MAIAEALKQLRVIPRTPSPEPEPESESESESEPEPEPVPTVNELTAEQQRAIAELMQRFASENRGSATPASESNRRKAKRIKKERLERIKKERLESSGLRPAKRIRQRGPGETVDLTSDNEDEDEGITMNPILNVRNGLDASGANANAAANVQSAEEDGGLFILADPSSANAGSQGR